VCGSTSSSASEDFSELIDVGAIEAVSVAARSSLGVGMWRVCMLAYGCVLMYKLVGVVGVCGVFMCMHVCMCACLHVCVCVCK